MSYSMWVKFPECPHCKVTRESIRLLDGMTWNLSPMVERIIERLSGGLKGYDTPNKVDNNYSWWRFQGHPVAVLKILLEPGLRMLIDEKEEFIKLNPANGWGSYGGFLKVWSEMIDKLRDCPETGTLEVWG